MEFAGRATDSVEAAVFIDKIASDPAALARAVDISTFTISNLRYGLLGGVGHAVIGVTVELAEGI